MYYIDDDFMLHLSPEEGLEPVELPELEGKCQIYIEGYRYVPQGQSWQRQDGQVFPRPLPCRPAPPGSGPGPAHRPAGP